MKTFKVPCNHCGKMITIPENRKGHKNFCDKYCKNKDVVTTSRGGVNVNPARNRPRRTRKCRSCGG